jgi:choline dehydrogenase-like flavoprotein
MMNLKSGAPFWVAKNGLLKAYPRLRESIQCDALVVGAGITGALIADQLTQAGQSVCVIDQREVGWGSTSASTALLQYEIDTELQDLCKQYGVKDGVLAYKACETAIGSITTYAVSTLIVRFALHRPCGRRLEWESGSDAWDIQPQFLPDRVPSRRARHNPATIAQQAVPNAGVVQWQNCSFPSY